ncbi:Uncharacterised protein [Pseudomonas aeruginosa]|nr:Uncharacterised protein [Pseudomonas aeruginosa]
MPVMMKGTMLSSGPSTTYLRVLVNSVAGGTLAITRSRWAMTSAVFAWFSSSCSAPRGFGEVGDEVPGFLVAHGNILGVGSEEEALGGISPSWRSRAWARAMSR